MYDNLEHKERVLLGKRVVKVDESKTGVQVTTQDGEIYRGDILVGADGVHSVVRKEMWRIANESNPGFFHANEGDSKWSAPFSVPGPLR